MRITYLFLLPLFSLLLSLYAPRVAYAQAELADTTGMAVVDEGGTFTQSPFFYNRGPLALFRLMFRLDDSYGLSHEQGYRREGSILVLPSNEGWGEGRGEKKKTISVDLAIAQLIAEQPNKRFQRAKSFGDPIIPSGADPSEGRRVYLSYCGDCHGADGQGPSAARNNNGKGLGPYGGRKPFLYLKVLPLNRWFAGGSTPEFAERSAFGVHAMLPDMSTAATLSHEAWADLQAFVAEFELPKEWEEKP